jgi:hypothetical protein
VPVVLRIEDPFSLTILGVYVQKKKNLNLNWNEELLSSMRPVIDQAFRTLLDKSCENFKAEAAQAIKEALRDLNHVLKSKSTYPFHRFPFLIPPQTTLAPWHAMPTRYAFRTTSSVTKWKCPVSLKYQPRASKTN